MIKQIKRLKFDSFKDFTWPNDLPDFARYNLLYGWNGSGKSTLVRLLQHLQDKTIPAGEVSLLVEGNTIDQMGFANVGIPIRVFSRDYVEKTVGQATRAQSGAVAPIYIIGKENVEKEKQANALRTEATTLQEQINTARTAKSNAERTRDSFFTSQARDIKAKLTAQGSAFNNYNRGDLSAKLQAMTQEPDPSTHALDDTQLATCTNQHQSTPKVTLNAVAYTFPDLTAEYGAVAQLLQKTVTAATIASLRDDPPTAAWVEKGLHLHGEKNSDTCLFCGQRIPAGRISELEGHFSKAYKQFCNEIDAAIARIEQLATKTPVALADKANLYDYIAAEYAQAMETFSQQLDSVRVTLGTLAEKLREKRQKPFDCLIFAETAPTITTGSLAAVNAVIEKHNRVSRDFAAEVKKAREQIEASHVAGILGDYKNHIGAVKLADDEITEKEAKRTKAVVDAEAIEREIVQHRQPAEELNRDLASYLGHGDIVFSIEQTGYRVTRGGQPATMLSEGELTAVALLYFLASLRGRDFDIAKGIVVMDDPVSSLDQNGIFIAFGFIKECTKDAKQLFILTHNFTFFRQVCYWLNKLPDQDKKDVARRPAHFGMVCASPSALGRTSTLAPLDPLLHNSESDYHYLFKCLCELTNAASGQPLDRYYGIPNMARRLLEMFLAFRVPNCANLWQGLDALPFDAAKKTAILRFVDTYSHADAVGGDRQDFSALSETPMIVRTLLELIREVDQSHYTGMLKVRGMPADPLATQQIVEQKASALTNVISSEGIPA